MNVNLSALSNYFKYPDKIAELKVRLYKILLDKNVEASAGESLNSLIEKVKQVEGNIPENTIYITENNTETGYDVTNYTKAIVDVQASAVENDLDKLLNNTIESCVIPQSINWLGPYKFYQCVNLEEVQGNTLLEISPYTFYGCSNLQSINLPYVRKIKSNAFTGCIKLTEMQVPELTHIEGAFFANASKLTYFDAPNLISWEGVSTGTVTGASKISYINLPALVRPNQALFHGISTVKNINIPNVFSLSAFALSGANNTTLSELNFPILVSTSQDAISGFNALTSLSFPLLTTVGGTTYCSSLTDISIPLARQFTTTAFQGCASLQRIKLPYLTGPTWNQTQDYYIFSTCRNLSEVSAPYLFSLSYPGYAFWNCYNLQSLELPRLYSAMFSNSAFSGCSLSLISFPNYGYFQAYSIYYNCFMNKPSLVEINLSRTMSLVSYMFLNDDKLRSVYAINASSIMNNCFQGCTSLSEFYFTGYSLYSSVFYNTRLQSLYLLNGSSVLVSLASNTFNNSPMTDNSILGSYGTIYVPSSLYSNYISATGWSSFSNIIQSLPSDIEERYFLASARYSDYVDLSEKQNASIVLPYAFYNTTITSFNLPEVTNIENSAVAQCPYLSQVSLDKVEHIAHSAFYNCTSLTSFYAPKLKETGINAFYGCYRLSSVDLPELEIAGAYAFMYCSGISTLNLPSARVIERGAFQSCYGLTSISLPEVELIDYSAFADDYSISAVSLPKVKVIGSSAFSRCSNISTAYLPEVELIEQYAFYSCSRLTSLVAPKLKLVSTMAFYSCSNLTSLSLPELKVVYGGFSNMTSLSDVYIPEVRFIGDYAFNTDIRLKSVYAGKAVAIGVGAFQNCSLLTNIDIPQVKSIGMSAFMYCSSLVSLSLPQVRAVEASAFYYCTKLEDLYIPNLVTLQSSAFACCYRLAEIPNASVLLSIPDYAFAFCSQLSEVDLPTCSYIGTGAFSNCHHISQVSIPLVNFIGAWAFASNSSLRAISNSYVTSLYSNVFTYCSALEEVNLPKVTSIREGTFRSCSSLSSLNINFSELESVPAYAFADCSNLDVFDNSEYWQNISSVGEGAFQGCAYLTQLINPSQSIISNYTYKGTNISDLTNSYITSMGISAFASNNSLENVDLPNCNYIGSSAFQSCPNLSNINLSSSLSYVGMYAFDTTSVSEITSNVQEYIEGLGYVPSGLYRNTKLTSISFESIESIYISAFEGCSLLNQTNLTTIKDIYQGAFSSCSSLTEISLPNIGSLGGYAFANCISLYEINLPLDLNRISWGTGVFSGCTQLSYFNCRNITRIPSKIFDGCSNLISVDISNARYFPANALNNCPSLVSVYLPYCTEMDIYADTTWSRNIALQTIYTPLSNYIADGLSLRNLINLREVTCPYIYLNRGNYSGCTSLESIYLLTSNSMIFSNVNSANWATTPIGNSTYLGYYGSFYVPSAFYSQMRANYGQYSGRWIVDRIASLPESMERKFVFGAELVNLSEIPENKLGAEYFIEAIDSNSCRLSQVSLSKVKILTGTTFRNCSTIQNVSFPEAITLPNYCFQNCRNLSQIYIPKAEDIGTYCFHNCSSLSEIELGNVMSIRSYAFQNCYSLSRLNISTVSSIAGYAFYNCSALSSVTLRGVHYIGDAAFYSCSSLAEVNLYLEDYAMLIAPFTYCTSLSQITINLPSKGLYENNAYNVFNGCYNIENLTIVGSNPNVSFSRLFQTMSVSNFYANDIVSGGWMYNMCANTLRIRYLEARNITSIPNYFCQTNASLITGKFDNASVIGFAAFSGCTSFEYVEFPKATALSYYTYTYNYTSYTFYNCQKLSVIVFGASEMVRVTGNWNYCFENTPIVTTTYLGYYGSIYVRKSLIGKYTTDSRWATYSSRFTAIEDNLPLLHRLGLCLSFTE